MIDQFGIVAEALVGYRQSSANRQYQAGSLDPGRREFRVADPDAQPESENYQ
jgi:hypothetical protein